MKNNLSYIICLFLFVILFFHNKISANEISFSTSEILITDNGNTANAGPGSAYSEVDNIKIDGESFKFDKNNSILIANNARTILSEKNIELIADQLIYDQKISTIKALGNVEINDLLNNVKFKSEEAIYNKNKRTITSNAKSSLSDKPGNNFITEQFIYTFDDNLIKIFKSKITDIQNNVYHIENAFFKPNNKQINW